MKFEDLMKQKDDYEIKQRRIELEEEVSVHHCKISFLVILVVVKKFFFAFMTIVFQIEKLQAELDEEQTVNKVLQCALHGPVISQPCLSTLLPPKVRPRVLFLRQLSKVGRIITKALAMQVQALLRELAMVEEEIIWLERKVDELKMRTYHEKKHTRELRLHQKPKRRVRRGNRTQLSGQGSASEISNKDLHVRTRSQNYEDYKKERNNSNRRASVGSELELLRISSTGIDFAGKLPTASED